MRIISRCGSHSCTFPKKAFLFPSVWPRTEYIWTLIWKKSVLIFVLKTAKMFPISTKGKRMVNTFIMVNSTPICKISSRGQIYSFPLQERPSFSFQFIQEKNKLAHSFERQTYCCFESYQSIPYSHRQSRKRMVNTLLMINITPICKR